MAAVEVFEEVPGRRLFVAGSADAGYVFAADEDTVTELADQLVAGGGVGRGLAGGAGEVRGVDESPQCLCALGRPDLAGMGFGGVGEITE